MNIVIILAGIIEASTALPYIRDIRLGKTKPAIVSWITWLLLSLLAALASYAEGAIVSTVIAGALVVECAAIILMSLNKGGFSYTRFDGYCQLAAVLGLVLWRLTNEPMIAIFLFVVVDAIGALPTWRHAWRRPKEETLSTFAWSILGNALALSAITTFTLTMTLVPLYLLLLNTILTIEIYLRRRFTRKKNK